jgi:tetratricopeptide (TPR) repeat protein
MSPAPVHARAHRPPLRRLAVCVALAAIACGGPDPIDEARQLLEAGRLAESIALLRAQLDERPGDPQLHYLYGSALLANRSPSLAVWPLRRAARDPELAADAGTLLARALLTGGAADDAVWAADAVLEIDPENAPVLALRAQAHLRSLDEEAALEDIERLIALGYGQDPDNLSLYQAKLEAELKLERIEEAEATIALLRARAAEVESFPVAVAARLCALAAVFSAEKGELEVAREGHEACLAEYPAAHIAVEEAIGFYDEERDFERGVEILERAIEAAPDDLQLRVQLAARLRDLKRSDEAEAALQEIAGRLDTAVAWTALADHYVELEDLAGAADALGRAVRTQAPDGHAADWLYEVPDAGLFAYADILVQLGDHERVREIIAALEEPAYKKFIEGRMHLERGEYAGANESYAQGLRLWPSNPGARYLAGQAAEQLGDFDLAISHYREALRANTSSTPAGLALARIQLAQGNRGVAADALRYHLQGHPQDVSALRLFADLSEGLDREAEAVAARRRMARIPGQAGTAVADGARDLRERLGADAALQFLAELEVDLSDPANADALRVWSELSSEQGRDAEVMERIDAVLAQHPEAAALHAVRGSALRRAHREPEAIAALERALALDAQQLPALLELAQWRADAGDVEAAVALYDRAVAVDPDDPAHAYAAAMLRRSSGADAEARSRLEALLRAHPWHGDSAYQLARWALQRGETDARALDYAERAARFRPGTEGVELLGRISLARTEYERAIVALRHIVETEESAPSANYYLGQALAGAGDTEGARAAYRAALDAGSFPEADAARRELTRLDAVPTDR